MKRKCVQAEFSRKRVNSCATLKLIIALFTVLHFQNASFCQTDAGHQVTEYSNISYTAENLGPDDTLRRLNLVVPRAEVRIPLLIWIGGGAWSYGDKDKEMDLARKLAAEGIAVACVGHRLSPAIWRDSSLTTGIRHPKHVQDVAAAVLWLYAHADDYGYDRNGLFIGGFSSGAHLAALISLDSSYLDHVGLSHKLFKGILAISGTYDISDYHDVLFHSDRPDLARLHVEAVFGNAEEGFIQASPVTYLDQLGVPFLLMSDTNMYNYSKLFEEKVRATEFRDMQVVYAFELSHGGLWRNLSFDEHSMYRQIVIAFIQKNYDMG